MVTNFETNGVWHQGFILDYYYDKGIICHKNASLGTLTTSVTAGGTAGFHWGPKVWPHPYGPILTYVAKCASGDCTKVDKTTLRWVKIAESGINFSTQTWALQDLINQGGNWTVTVPKSLASGAYVFRHDIIALHGANTLNGAQNCPQRFNINITGGGTAEPQGVLGTQLYKNTDPGINLNPYVTLKSHTMPGPALFSG